MISSHFTAAKKNSKHGGLKEDTSHSAHSVSSNSETTNVEGSQNDLGVAENNSDSLGNIDEGSDLKKGTPKDVVETCTKEIAEEEVELGSMFFEDSSAWDAVAPEILKQQKIEKLSHDGYGHLLGNIDDIWKKVQLLFLFLHIDGTCFMFDLCFCSARFLTVHFSHYREILVKCQKLFYKSFVRDLVGKHPNIVKYLRKVVNLCMLLTCCGVLLAVVRVGRLEA